MRTNLAVAILVAATATLPQASHLVAEVRPAPSTHAVDPFFAFRDRGWHLLSQSDIDILTESGRARATLRRWEYCVSNDYKIVCPGGYVTRWQPYEDESNQAGL